MNETKELEKKEIGGLTVENPQDFITTVTQVADALKSIIEKQKLYALINLRKFVTCEGWTTLASLCGFIPSIQNVEVYKDGDVLEAKAEAVLQKRGQIVAKAIAYCRSDETKFSGKRMQEKYEVASMAQTRAVSKVCRIALSWIMTMAGYEPTPAEEIGNSITETEKSEPEIAEQVTEGQLKMLYAVINSLKISDDVAKETAGRILNKEIRSFKELSKKEASILIDEFKKKIRKEDNNKNE